MNEVGVPTRVLAKVRPSYDGQTAYELPSEWEDGADVTVILGRDELPEEVRKAVMDISEMPISGASHQWWMSTLHIICEWARSRWPEAFK